MTIWYDPERSIGTRCSHEDDGISFPYRLQKFPLLLSSSYRVQNFADTDRLRVNRRPIRKDFFPDRYGFVPIVFTSSSCKRGLSISGKIGEINLASISELNSCTLFCFHRFQEHFLQHNNLTASSFVCKFDTPTYLVSVTLTALRLILIVV